MAYKFKKGDIVGFHPYNPLALGPLVGTVTKRINATPIIYIVRGYGFEAAHYGHMLKLLELTDLEKELYDIKTIIKEIKK